MIDRNQIFTDCSHAVKLLMKLTREACTNTLSDNVKFIKCYEVEEEMAAEEIGGLVQYLQFANRNLCDLPQLVDDIYNYLLAGSFISWIDFTMYYASEKETFISVYLVFVDHEVPPEYHIGILTELHNQEKEKYDLNEYVLSFKRKYRDILVEYTDTLA